MEGTGEGGARYIAGRTSNAMKEGVTAPAASRAQDCLTRKRLAVGRAGVVDEAASQRDWIRFLGS